MGWAIWLAVPLLATIGTALIVWWRGRPAPQPRPAQAIRDHQRYLDALAEPARQAGRQPRS